MKCPKCGYIGFEPTDRCRNCGYEFSLAGDAPAEPDLPINAADEPGPLADLEFRVDTPAGVRRTPSRALDLDRVIGAPLPAEPDPGAASDLPLFSAGSPDDAARAHTLPERGHIRTPAGPAHSSLSRHPLAARRQAAEPPRPRPRPRDAARVQTATLDLPLPPAAHHVEAAPTYPEPSRAVQAIVGPAPLGARVAAGSIDLVLLGTIDVVTVILTLRLVGLSPAEWHLLPMVPLAAFFLLLNGGYLAVFTAASGQTIGKMTVGLKVVSDDAGPVPLGAASLRAAGALASTLFLGVGLWPAAADEQGLALYDRLAQTRVVRIGA